MRANHGRDTRSELRLRRALHARGLRFRVQYPVPGSTRRTIDIAFTRARLAVFVDGCFWHGCPLHYTVSKTNPAFWAEKLRSNRARDAATNQLLLDAGWEVQRFWEHVPVEEVVGEIETAWRSATGR